MWQTLSAGRGGHILLSMAALLHDELHIVVTECGNAIWEREICRRGTAPGPDAGWSVWIRGGRPCGWQNRTPRVFRAFGIRTGKRCLSTAASAPQTRQITAGSIRSPTRRRSPSRQQPTEAKITYVRTEHPGDPDDAITWRLQRLFLHKPLCWSSRQPSLETRTPGRIVE